MGCWNATDMVTGLPIMCREQVRFFVLIQNLGGDGSACYPDDFWSPVGFAAQGAYNDYGSVKGVKDGLAAAWLTHLLPMDESMAKEIQSCGSEKAPELERKLLAVERGLAKLDGKPLTLWMTLEQTWKKMLEVEREDRESEGYGAFLEKQLESLRKLARLGNEEDMFLLGLPMNLFGTNECIAKLWSWVEKECREELINQLEEHHHFIGAMGLLRRYFCPIAGTGSQNTSWKAHLEVAKMVEARCLREMEREEKE